MKKIFLLLCSICLVFVLAFVIEKGVNNVYVPSYSTTESELPRVETFENLLALLKENQSHRTGFITFDGAFLESTADDMAFATNSSTDKGESAYSETNVQVSGVDEADIIKTDGEYIYQLTNTELIITKVYPAEDMHIVDRIVFNEYTQSNTNLNPIELYVDDNNIVVIASKYGVRYAFDEKEETETEKMISNKNLVMALIYNKSTHELKRKIEIEGDYVSSRKIGSAVYLVSNKYMYYKKDCNEEDIMPILYDTCAGQEYRYVDVADMCYFPNFKTSACLLITGFNTENNKEANISSYLGAGNEIYASKDNLYVTQNVYENVSILRETANKILGNYNGREETTNIYKFAIDNGTVNYIGMGNVPGRLLNQFSMDENGEYFRIATTFGNTWDNTSENNLYVLDRDMQVVGKLEGLAKGERIYSTRFMGDKCYIVTYKNVDPLFVIDLSDNENPLVLGELKIPGYSDYLHPYGENYLFGFGKETIVKQYKDWEGNVQETAYEVGLKMALFDISDFENPKEVHSIKIGDRGSYSELSYNHKALLFDEEKNIIAFPASITQSKGVDSKGVPNYGETIFEGALVYGLDLENGFDLKSKITHKDNEKYDYNKNVQRILYIEDRLYTISNSVIKANDINTFDEIGKIEM